jgi:protein gp37
MMRYGRDFTTLTRSKSTFKDPLKWSEPRRIFVCSWSDFFHPDADHWRDEAFDVMRRAAQHTYLILTKRIERAGDYWLGDVWLGVSAETQKMWDARVPILRKTPAAVKWVSVEPLLGPIVPVVLDIDWLVVGGESGPNYRPMHASWVSYLRDECVAAGVPFFFKQWGGPTPKSGGRKLDGRTWDEYPCH